MAIISFQGTDILNGEDIVIYGMDMEIEKGDFVYIVGKVGTGKTSIGESIARALGLYFADTAGWRIHMTYDEVHFSPAGHAAFAAQMDRLLRQVLEIRK